MTRKLSLEKRSGLAMVEMALVLPVLLLLAIGVMDYGMQFYVLHLMSDAARDAAREAAVRSGTVAQAQAVAASDLSGMPGHFTITVVQPVVGASNQDVTVTISVPVSDVALGFFAASGQKLQTGITMRKESG